MTLRRFNAAVIMCFSLVLFRLFAHAAAQRFTTVPAPRLRPIFQQNDRQQNGRAQARATPARAPNIQLVPAGTWYETGIRSAAPADSEFHLSG
jgi:hypothetical protein